MMYIKLPHKAMEYLSKDATANDAGISRCKALLQILWFERYLTRTQLISKLEYRLGKINVENTFHRDIQVVKQAFQSANFILEYSRKKKQSGYYLKNQPALLPEFRKIIKASMAEVDIRQIEIYHTLSFATRFKQGCDISDTARNVVAYRIREENPKLSVQEANQIALQRAYTL